MFAKSCLSKAPFARRKPAMKINHLKVLARDRKIHLSITTKKEDLVKAPKAWEEARRAQAQLVEQIIPDSGDEEGGREFLEEEVKGANESVAPFKAYFSISEEEEIHVIEGA
ncbi:hypothetical protein NDU88_005151 [Pleurodeles waltl]|uniref:Uncharacterized protein n=1 Tax=Pleurodeles waltl TaxID=8319 RepID=A0AAV7TA57_PLEWA|nr:hypothetical protein NDU88_005151 [Pleurodeles waltl]